MVYANDEWVQVPVMLLYDTGLMQSAINNARYMYEKAEKRMDDFYEKYGEFMSPFLKDMDRYQQIVGGVRKGIDALYASGEDPLRTASGRAKLAQLIRSVDPAEMSRMKANAKMGYAYLDDIEKARAKNEFNADYENFLLNQPGGPGRFQDFSSADGAMWTRSAAGRYQDLNQYTSHIFDALKDSFIRTDGPFDYYGVTEGDLAKSLTPDTLGGLLNTDLGKFHYLNAIRDLMAQGVTDPSKAAVMDQFRKNVIAANHEKVHENRSINEMWKLKQEHASRMSAARATASGIQQALQPSPLGANTMLAVDSATKHSTNKMETIKSAMKTVDPHEYNRSRIRFGQIDDKYKDVARMYMQAKDILNKSNATPQEIEAAKAIIATVSAEKDKGLSNWVKGYDKLYDRAEEKWKSENTIRGLMKYASNPGEGSVYNAQKKLYAKNYEVNLRASGLGNILNTQLGYMNSDEGTYSYMSENKLFDPVAMSKIFGGYKNTALVNKIQKALSGKRYFEDSSNIKRKYGSASVGGNTKNTIRESVIFKDDDVKKFFDNLSDTEKSRLYKFDIVPIKDENKNITGWRIPITTMIDRDLSWSYVDSKTDQDVGGTTLAGNLEAEKQAMALSGK